MRVTYLRVQYIALDRTVRHKHVTIAEVLGQAEPNVLSVEDSSFSILIIYIGFTRSSSDNAE